ncbi:MAG: SDR family NAD(P)-dependent oxidoreductase [Thermomicrobiales bacterium]
MPRARTFAISAAAGLGAALALRARQRHDARQYSFQGRTVAITGGSRGLGLVLAREFAQEGARLALLARDRAELDRAAREHNARRAEVLTNNGDVRDRADVQAAVARIIEHYGTLEVLVNNAGVISSGPVEHLGLADFDNALDVHFHGPLYTMLAALPHFRRQGGGRVVNIASIGGLIAVPHLLPYSASKFALVGLSDGMRAELARGNILITTVCPGLMRTGSPPNVLIKGRHRAEYAWFALADALPGLTIAADRATRQIVEACRRGDPALTITLPARAAALANALSPRLTARALALVNRLLPKPTGPAGDIAQTGWQSQSPLAPSPLTHLSDVATLANNEVPDQATLA